MVNRRAYASWGNPDNPACFKDCANMSWWGFPLSKANCYLQKQIAGCPGPAAHSQNNPHLDDPEEQKALQDQIAEEQIAKGQNLISPEQGNLEDPFCATDCDAQNLLGNISCRLRKWQDMCPGKMGGPDPGGNPFANIGFNPWFIVIGLAILFVIFMIVKR